MHASSYENMQKCYDRYLTRLPVREQDRFVVVDIGSADVNGGYRGIFSHPRIRYMGVDIVEGEGVDVVATSPYIIPLPDAFADLVISGQMLEHSEYFWLSFKEMVRLVKPEGLLFLIAPSAGPIHRYPVDCYRFYPDAYHALAKLHDCHLIDTWLDERGPWKDLVGVFSKQLRPQWKHTWRFETMSSDTFAPQEQNEFDASRYQDHPEVDIVSGSSNYLELIQLIHQHLAPSNYLEIGVRRGAGLCLANCPAIGIDPAPDVTNELPTSAMLYCETSDDFFEFDASHALRNQIDFAFIDGMHKFEYVLRDFTNVERYCGAASLIVIDDIFPNHPTQARRTRQSRVWTGDVWKLYSCLRAHRSDLLLVPVNTSPTGSLLVAGLDSSNRQLTEAYNSLVSHFVRDGEDNPPCEILDRTDAVEPDDPRIKNLLVLLCAARSGRVGFGVFREQLDLHRRELV